LRRGAVATLLLFALAGTAAAEIRSPSITFEPASPTWRDPVTAVLRGESECFVSAGEVQVLFDVEIAVAQSCSLAPPVFQPFTLRVELPRLTPGKPTVRFLDGTTVLVQRQLTVYHFLTDVHPSVPGEPIVAGEPFEILLSERIDGCSHGEAEVSGSTLSVVLPDDCVGVPPPSPPSRYTVQGLAAGEYTLRVLRTVTSPPSLLTRPLRIYSPDGCVPSATTLCLGDARFRVEVAWSDFQGGAGMGQAVPLEGRDDTGLFWFFNPANVELTVKVLDGCGVNRHYWVFVSSGSTVQYEVTVTDTQADQTLTYGNEAGVEPPLVADTTAFTACP
jgi:hypothetical protein